MTHRKMLKSNISLSIPVSNYVETLILYILCTVLYLESNDNDNLNLGLKSCVLAFYAWLYAHKLS